MGSKNFGESLFRFVYLRLPKLFQHESDLKRSNGLHELLHVDIHAMKWLPQTNIQLEVHLEV